ncbi:MAG: hypothetical protein ACP5JG_01460 [Anaerolineae bacterium]
MVVRRISRSLAFALILALLSITGIARAQPPLQSPEEPGDAAESEPLSVAVAVSPLLQYQGRLTNPDTGEPVNDGIYEMSFRLYDVESGGSPLWQETKDVPVQGGVFATALGDTAMLDHGLFNGQALWLGIKVGADAEATPRQPMLPVAYALSLVPGAAVSTNSVDPALHLENTGSGDGLVVGGSATVTGDLNVGGGLVGGGHTHDGEDITTGTVHRARIDSLIARDSEIVPTMLANDGAGSTLDADLLDGRSSEDFADAAHNHDARYYTKTQIENNFVNSTGPDAMSANHTDPVLSVTQDGAGVAGYFFAGSDHAVVGETTGAGAGQAGVLGESTGTGDYQAGVLGVTGGAGTGQAGVKGMAGDAAYTTGADAGVFGESTGSFGVLGHSDSYFGIYGHSESGTGVRGDSNGAAHAVSGYNYGTGYGGYFYAVGGTALRAYGSAEVTQNLDVWGDITTDRVAYSVPRTHYFTVGGEAFVPGSNVDYTNTYGMGGAYIHSGSGGLVAPVHLPHGAVVTGLQVFFNDTSSSDMSVSLYRLSLTAGAYSGLASVSSSGTSGYYNLSDTTISNATINNTAYSYHIYAYSSSWSSSLKIMGAVITYTIDEAP